MIKLISNLWKIWKKFGTFIANTIGIILSILAYIVVVTPFGITISLFKDYLKLKIRPEQIKTMWIDREPADLILEDMGKQY